MALDHETLARPTTALWPWLDAVHPGYANLYLDGGGHLKTRTARELVEACDEVLGGAEVGRPAPLSVDSGEATRVMHACIVAFTHGYGLEELAEEHERAQAAARTAVSAGDWVALTTVEQRFYTSLKSALRWYLELKAELGSAPEYSEAAPETTGLTHELLASPTVGPWVTLVESDQSYPDLYLDGAGHLRAALARTLVAACAGVLAGEVDTGELADDSEAGRAFVALVMAFTRGYELSDLVGWAALAPSAPKDRPGDESLAVGVALSAADRRYWGLLKDHLERYLELREDIHEYPQWSGVDATMRTLRTVGAVSCRAEAGCEEVTLDPFWEVTGATTELWVWLDDRDARYPDEYLDGWGHLRTRTAMDMVKVCERLREGRLTRWDLAEEWPAFSTLVIAFIEGYKIVDLAEAYDRIHPLSYDGEAETDTLDADHQAFFDGLAFRLCDYLNARPATLGIVETFTVGPRLFEYEDAAELTGATKALAGVLAGRAVQDPGRYLDGAGHLSWATTEDIIARCGAVVEGRLSPHDAFTQWPDLAGLVAAFLDGYGILDRSATSAFCEYVPDRPGLQSLGYGQAEVPAGWRDDWRLLRMCLQAYWAARRLVLVKEGIGAR